MINKGNSECLNESDDHTFLSCLNSSGGYLESDTDEQVLISYLLRKELEKLSLPWSFNQ